MSSSSEVLFIIGSNVISGAEYVLGDYIKNSSFSRQMTIFHADFEQGNSYYSKLPVKETKAFKELNPVGANNRRALKTLAKKIVNILNFYRKLAREERTNKYSSIIGNNTGDIVYLAFSSINTKFLIVHDDLSGYRRLQLPIKLLSKRLTGFIAVSKAVKNSLVNLGVPDDHIRVVYNGLPRENGCFHDRIQIGRDSIEVLFVGQLNERKDPLVALRFCKKMSQFSKKKVIFRIVYNHVEPETLNKVTEFIDTCKGYVDVELFEDIPREEIKNFYNISHYLILSSKNDALPTCILEAFQHGLPVIARRVGGVPEMVKDGYNGFLFENEHALLGDGTDETDSIVNRVVNIGDEQYKQLSENALRTFTSRFTLDKKVALLDQILFAQEQEDKS